MNKKSMLERIMGLLIHRGKGFKTTINIPKPRETDEIREFKRSNPLELQDRKSAQAFIRNTGLDEDRWRSYWLVRMNPDGLTEEQIETNYGRVELFREFGGIVIDEMYLKILQIQNEELRDKIALLYQQEGDCIRDECLNSYGLTIHDLTDLGFEITRKD